MAETKQSRPVNELSDDSLAMLKDMATWWRRRPAAEFAPPPPPRVHIVGQPVWCYNADSVAMPTGGLGQLNGSLAADNLGKCLTRPQYPGIAQSLVIACAPIPAGGYGMCWPMDGCVHPVAVECNISYPVPPAA